MDSYLLSSSELLFLLYWPHRLILVTPLVHKNYPRTYKFIGPRDQKLQFEKLIFSLIILLY